MVTSLRRSRVGYSATMAKQELGDGMPSGGRLNCARRWPLAIVRNAQRNPIHCVGQLLCFETNERSRPRDSSNESATTRSGSERPVADISSLVKCLWVACSKARRTSRDYLVGFRWDTNDGRTSFMRMLKCYWRCRYLPTLS